MPGQEPRTATPIAADATTALPWEDVAERLRETSTYWLATIHPSGRPHARPVLAAWVDGVLHSVASPRSRKARNLALDPRCTFSVSHDHLDVVVEGEAVKVTDAERLQRVADAYATKYEWPATVGNGAFDGPEGAPTAGPPPYAVYEIVPRVVFGFGTNEELAPRSTRWDF